VLTDASTKAEADRLGVEFAPELNNALGHAAVRQATWNADDTLTFASGTVDFSGERSLTPGQAPALFPPASFTPGSTADAEYSPFVRVSSNGEDVVYSAPIVAFGESAEALDFCDGNVDYSKVHDRVTAICPATKTVSIKLSHGYASSHEVVYFSFDTNNPMAATMEAATHAPALSALADTGTALDIFAVANGETGAQNPERQGFDSALAGDGSPLNVLAGSPSSQSGYSPLWSLTLAQWTSTAITGGQRHRLISSDEFQAAESAGTLTGPDGAAIGPTGILINCPVVAILNP
jgi:hypothetical protein